ncbi:MAG: prepilin peptidase [Opitutales bacterium]
MWETVEFIQSEYPWVLLAFFFVFGACWGSFLNVVVYRLPAGKSLSKPPSHCYGCGKPIRWYDNLPILSWCLLRGKARCCGATFSMRYAIIEALTGLLFALCWWQFGPETPLKALAAMVFVFFLLAGSFIDLDTMELPDVFTVGGAVLAVLLSFALPSMHGFTGEVWIQEMMRSGMTAMVGVLVGSAVVLWILVLAEAVLKKEAMGFGDVLWVGFIGGFCGWQGGVFAVFGGALLGSIGMLPILLVQRMSGSKAPHASSEALPSPCASLDPKAAIGDVSRMMRQRDAAAKGEALNEADAGQLVGRAIPFGPWLALAGLLYFLLVGEYVDAWFADVAQTVFGGALNPR